MPTANRFKAWSYSRYVDYVKCPAFARYKHLDKRPTPKNAAMERGAHLAAAGEAYLKRATDKLDPELRPVKRTFDNLRKLRNLAVEQQLGFTETWAPCAWNDWDRCWLRVKMDVSFVDLEDNVLEVIDNKTGRNDDRFKDDYEAQLEIYQAAGAAQYPHVVGIRAQLLYTDSAEFYPVQPLLTTRREAEALQAVWSKRVRGMLNDTRFAPRPGDHCRWCPFSKAKGGPCRY